MVKFLIIQTAFIGDVILATPLIEKLNAHFPQSKIDFLLRKGNEQLLLDHPKIHQLHIWNKKEKKIKNLFRILWKIRKEKYDYVINIQRFSSTGLLTAFSKSKQKIGFRSNPFSFLFTDVIPHSFEKEIHEIDRNLSLINKQTNNTRVLPKLYPNNNQYVKIKTLQTSPYICIAPTSVWFTKQFPKEKWIAFCNRVPEIYTIYLLGAPSDAVACDEIKEKSSHKNIINISGKLTLLESAALMEKATMNYVNDSAPLHLCSAMNAPCTAVFCSTVPAFGFGPLSEKSFIVETQEKLDCRPCGIHGFMECPIKTFECAYSIDIQHLLDKLT